MANNSKITSTDIELLYDLLKQGISQHKIAKQLNISGAHAGRLTYCLNIHGLEKLKQFPQMPTNPNIKLDMLSAIVEFQLAFKLPIWKTACIFSLPVRILENAVNQRKKYGHELVNAGIASIPAEVNREFIEGDIAKYNPGKSIKQIRSEYREACEQQEVSVAPQDVQPISTTNVQARTRDLKLEEFRPSENMVEDIIYLSQHGVKACELVRLYEIQASQASRILQFISIHGVEEYRRLPTLTEQGGFENKHIASMLEFAIAYNIPSNQAGLIFKVTERRLITMRNLRKKEGRPLYDASIANLPSTANPEVVQSIIRKFNPCMTQEQLNTLYMFRKQNELWGDSVDFSSDKSFTQEQYNKYISSQPTLGVNNMPKNDSNALNDEAVSDKPLEEVSAFESEVVTDVPQEEANAFDNEAVSDMPQYEASAFEDEAVTDVSKVEVETLGNEAESIATHLEEIDSSNIKAKPIIVGSSSTNRTTVDSLPEPVMGRARAEVKAYRGKKKDLNRELTNANKEQKRLLAQKAQDAEQTANAANDDPESIAISIALEHIDKTLDSLSHGIPAKEYKRVKGQAGRDPIIDITSEGFTDLPADVQYRELKRYAQEISSMREALKKKQELTAILSNKHLTKGEKTKLKVEKYLELVEEQPDIIKGVAMKAFGINAQQVNYYKNVRTEVRKDYIAKNKALDEATKEIYDEHDGKIGVHTVRMLLLRREISVSVPTVRKSLRRQGLEYVSPVDKSNYNSYKGNIGKIAPDLVKRNFNPSRPFEIVTTDITMFLCVGGTNLYLSVYLDLFNNEVLSYAISASPSQEFAMSSFAEARKMQPEGVKTIYHSDQGSHYQHHEYVAVFENNEYMVQSMSRKGNSLDNGAMESFFGRAKCDLGYLKRSNYLPYDELSHKLQLYISKYNNARPQERLNGLSPVEYKNQWEKTQNKPI